MVEGQRMTVSDVVAEVRDGRVEDFLREAVMVVARELMEAEVSGQVGAQLGEVAPETRVAYRNGYRPRSWETRVGDLELLIPIKHAIARVLGCSWQRCTVHFVRDMLAHCRRDQRGLVSAALREVFNADDQAQARERVGHVLERLEPVCPKVCRLLEAAEEDLIAFYQLPGEHWTKLRSTNPLERVNKEIGRRSDVVGIFPNDQAVIRLAGALLAEQTDEWLLQRRYLSVESMALILSAGKFEEDTLEHHQELGRVTPPQTT